MSRQTLANFAVPDDQRAELTRALQGAGFHVREQRRAGGNLLGVLIREGTKDEAEAVAIIDRLAPWSRRGPGSVPTSHVDGYREGR